MSLFTGMAILEERFSTAYFRFNDNTAAELQPGLRAPEDAEEFVTRWDETARTLAQADAMRSLATFSGTLPIAGASTSKDSPATRAIDPDDRFLHARLQGNKLGVFDIFFDSMSVEQVQAGQTQEWRKWNRLLQRLDLIRDREWKTEPCGSERDPSDIAGGNGVSGRSGSRAQLRY